MTFRGFPPECLTFYEGLERDNTRAYWTAHRDEFEAAVRGPMRELLVTLDEQWGPFHLFRPNRDVRFAKDKSPYKTALGAVGESERAAHFYVQISAAGLFVASGFYHMTSDQLERYRAAVDDARRGGQLVKLVREVEGAGLDVHVRDALQDRAAWLPEGPSAGGAAARQGPDRRHRVPDPQVAAHRGRTREGRADLGGGPAAVRLARAPRRPEHHPAARAGLKFGGARSTAM